MAQGYTTEKASSHSRAAWWSGEQSISVMSVLFIVFLAFLSISQQAMPDVATADAPASDFSSGRAMKHLQFISQNPHPVGSPQHALVRAYILKELAALGVEPEVQKTAVLDAKRPSVLNAATVHNIIAKLKGTGSNNKAILVTGHYDTVPNSPGASDDGSAVVTMLETLRALKAGSPLSNDVIFLFTDGEELGLLGAKAFVDEHPLAKDIGLVLNFEARGAGGAVLMFETSAENGWLIKEFAKTVPYPHANSLTAEIYKLLPNDTDLSIFKQAKLPGLNFSYIDGVTRYHTRSDNVGNIDERSIQHDGSYALTLTRHFGSLNVTDIKTGDVVYFDMFGRILLYYPVGWVVLLTVLTTILFAGVIIYGLRRGRLTFRRMIVGFAAFLLTLIVVPAVVAFIWWLIRTLQLRTGYDLQDDMYQSNLYFIGFIAINIALTTTLYNLFRKKITINNLAAGSLLCWLLLLIVVSVLIPGGSYLLMWPLFFSLVGVAFVFRQNEQGSSAIKRFAILSLCSIPGIIILVPAIRLIFVALGLNMIGQVSILIVLLFGLLIPFFSLMPMDGKWLLTGAIGLTGLAFLGVAGLTSGFDREYPKYNSVAYYLNADEGKAVWASTDATIDEWTTQFFSANPERGYLSEYIPSTYNGFLKSPAPLAQLAPATVKLLDDHTIEGVRTLRLNVATAHPNVSITVPADSNTEVLAAAINGKRIETSSQRPSNLTASSWALQYAAPDAQGIDLILEVKAAQPLKLRVVDQSYGLPEIPEGAIKPRPDYMMPAPLPNSDSTYVSRLYVF